MTPSTEHTKDPLTVIQATLAALREVEAKATPGRFVIHFLNDSIAGPLFQVMQQDGDADSYFGINGFGAMAEGDASFVATSRNSLLPLIEAVEKQFAALVKAQALIQTQHQLLVAAHEHIDWTHSDEVQNEIERAIAETLKGLGQ
jgi:hypothetical protein